MWTIKYRGIYIHGYCDRDEVHYMDHRTGCKVRKPSLESAKRAIRKVDKVTIDLAPYANRPRE